MLLRLYVWLEESGLERIKELFRRIHAASFSVYPSLALFLTLVTGLLQTRGINGVMPLTAARAVACYTVPFLLYWLLILF